MITFSLANEALNTHLSQVHGQFARRRTHNEQIYVLPCGVVIHRITFYGHESVSSVAVRLPRPSRVPTSLTPLQLAAYMAYQAHGRKPDLFVYDNNCGMKRYLESVANKESELSVWFRSIGLPVDPFHFKSKHKETDEYCRDYCDPDKFSELTVNTDTGKRYYFNTAVAEQTNSWLGRYHSIVREMRASRFNFFLDEMIVRRNRGIIAELERTGAQPGSW